MEALVYFIFGIIASLLINLATPSMQKWLEGKSLINKNKKLIALKEEMKYIEELRGNINKLSAIMHIDLVVLFGLVVLLIIIVMLTIHVQVLSVQVPMFDSFVVLGMFNFSGDGLESLILTLQFVSQILLYLGLLISIVIGTIILNIYTRTRKIKQFEEYQVEINNRVKQLEQTK